MQRAIKRHCKFLPEKIKARIAFRKKEGPHKETTQNQRLLNEKITVILAKYAKDDEFLSEHIVTKLFETFKEKGSKGRKPYYFRLIKKISARVLAEAKEKVG